MTSSATNLLVNNVTYLNTTKDTVFYSSQLLNYVEPVEISGFRKTVFYSELNTNINVGDRVFILNGNYDSNEYILQDKYTKYTDGYRVLGVDGCRIILDIDYTGAMPYESVDIDNIINVYHVKNQREFDYINSLIVGKMSNLLISKFSGTIIGLTASSNFNSIIYAPSNFDGSSSYENLNSGISGVPGMWMATDANIGQTRAWNNMSSFFDSGNLSKSKFQVIGEDITYGSRIYKQRNVYKFENGKWVVDISYKKPILSKLNFRYGKFKGKHNDGIFGTNLKSVNWDNATWNSGVFVNSNWSKGLMNSKSIEGVKSYYSKLKVDTGAALPVQTIDYSNNKGFGYNLILDSNFYSGEIKNGDFLNSNIGLSSTFSSIDIYYGLTYSNDIIVNRGQYKLCDVNSVDVNNSIIINSKIYNSNINATKIINSQVYDSVASKSEFSNHSGIKVIAADLWSYSSFPIAAPTLTSTYIRGVLKLYISNDDISKFNIGDSFYLSKINKDYILSSLNDDQKVLLPVEAKYVLDLYFDKEVSSNKIKVSVRNKIENRVKYQAHKKTINLLPAPLSFTNNQTSLNNYDMASIDIDSNSFGWYIDIDNTTTKYLNSYILSPITRDNVDKVFTNTYIHDADFKSGLFTDSTWLIGDNINHTYNKISNITYHSPNQIYIDLDITKKMNADFDINGQDTFIGDTVWLNSIDMKYATVLPTGGIGLITSSIAGRYKVFHVSSTLTTNRIYLETMDGLTFSPYAIFSITGAPDQNYSSIHKFLINNSTVKEGLLRRTGLLNSKTISPKFNNLDKKLILSNNDILKIVNIIFKDTNNTINAGLIYKSHFVNDIWNNGIIFNSIWNGGLFGNGIFKGGYWLDGTFNNGSFIDSGDLVTTAVDYDSVSKYRNWLNGTFNLGEFFNSVWLNGILNNGRFYNSDWYGGTWNNGVLGSKNYACDDTTLSTYSPLSVGATFTTWNNGIVENAKVGGSGSVYWYNGKFSDGEFTSYGSDTTNESIWYNGDFNGGKVTNLARWKNGTFNKGKFLSYYGWENVSPTNPSTYSTDYGWENGKFNGGEFGDAGLTANSVWYNGQFNNGVFTGRFWNNGIFHKGSFIGSGLTGGSYSIYNSPNTSLDEFKFADSFTNSYYGLWNNGFVIDVPHNVKSSERVFTELIRKVEEKRLDNIVNISNILWLNGTFSHKNATIQNSVWLNGTFEKGTFDSSIFNAYVDRDFTGSFSNSSFASTQSSVWLNGKFNSTYGTGSFYISDWKSGTFNSGYMSGASWRNGVWNYGTAENIYWENGSWRNGNWNGSPFDYTSISTASNIMIPSRSKDIVLNISNSIGTSSIHIINVFSASITPLQVLSDINVNTINGPTSSWVFDDSETYIGIVGYQSNNPPIIVYDSYPRSTPSGGVSPIYGGLSCSQWGISNRFTYSNTQYSTDSNAYTFGGQSEVGGRFSQSPIPGYNSGNIIIPQSSKLYAYAGSTTSVFATPNTTYNIKLLVGVELAPIVTVEFGIGAYPYSFTLSSTPNITSSANNYWPKIYTINLNYNTTNELIGMTNSSGDVVGNKFYIKKTSGGVVRLIKGEITERITEYHSLNNTIYNGVSASNVYLPNDPNLSLQASSDSGNIVSINYGNGVFRSGVWENGVWNNGYRSGEWFNESDYYVMSDVIGVGGLKSTSSEQNTYQIDNKTWLITLKSLDNLSNLLVGDKVSIGNIVAIDVNESRRLIKDYYRVVSIDNVNRTLRVKFVTDFPIRRIVKDSVNHLIYVTKNIWLSGAFLNGLFTGVWNNGLFKGYPMITEISDTHWIDGTFDGGHFISSNINADSTNLVPAYNTSVIQKFKFYDNNTAQVDDFNYLSWMDINYFTASLIRLNKDITIFNELNIFGGTAQYYQNLKNLYGYPTADVLDSYSYFRDSDTLNTQSYKLGTKYVRYENFIPNDGNFIQPFSEDIPFVGMDNFENLGWTFSDFLAHATQSSNISIDTAKKWKMSIQDEFVFSRFDNSNIITEANRYYMIDANLSSSNINLIFSDLGISTWVNHSVSRYNPIESSNNKFEYFYNTQDLNMWVAGASFLNLELIFNNISFYEVDMIPFFQYATESHIDMDIKTPLRATAPYIDYNNSNFDFVGNINLTFDTQDITSQQPSIQSGNISVNTSGGYDLIGDIALITN